MRRGNVCNRFLEGPHGSQDEDLGIHRENSRTNGGGGRGEQTAEQKKKPKRELNEIYANMRWGEGGGGECKYKEIERNRNNCRNVVNSCYSRNSRIHVRKRGRQGEKSLDRKDKGFATAEYRSLLTKGRHGYCSNAIKGGRAKG